MKNVFLTLIAFVAMASPAMAISTATTYSSPILVLLFVGFCALIIVMQLVPAVLVLIGATKAAVRDAKTGKLVKTKV